MSIENYYKFLKLTITALDIPLIPILNKFIINKKRVLPTVVPITIHYTDDLGI